MKKAQINFVGAVIGQLSTVPQHQLTQEYIATLFADRLERRYTTNFNRSEFLELARVSPRMAEDAEEKGNVTTLRSPSEVEKAVGPGGAWADVPGVKETVGPIRTRSGHLRPFARRGVGCS